MTYVPLTPLSERTYIAIAADGRLWNTNKNELLSENHITMAGGVQKILRSYRPNDWQDLVQFIANAIAENE